MAPLFSNISIQYMKKLFQSFHNSGDYMTKFIHIFDIVFVGVGSPSTAICLQMMHAATRGARWLSGRVSDSGARGPGFETYRRRVVSLSKTLYSPKVLVNYPGSDGSVPT